MLPAPAIRVRSANEADVDPAGDYVLYWMIAHRRPNWNFSLQHAAHWAEQLNKPLVILEALRSGYRWASDRLHAFVIQGMRENARRLADRPVLYYPYLEPEPQAGKGLFEKLAGRAALVVADDFPCFFLPAMVQVAARRTNVRFELVDGNGLLPLRAAPQVYLRAYDFRRFLQKTIRPHLEEFPDPDPLHGATIPELSELPRTITRRWPVASLNQDAASQQALGEFPIDHNVPKVEMEGGVAVAERVLERFLSERLSMYGDQRNQPEVEATSGLSPYLHFGHLSAHQVFAETAQFVGWSPDQLSSKATGSAREWWNADPEVESFWDELITWRELGYNMCWQDSKYDRYESLPDWARKTLEEHASDPREATYSLEEFERSETHDPLWNAAQRQLTSEGRIHNYLRMLWGKKILEWSPQPRDALRVMIELNNKYALDGRNPNSYSGIFWVLGRYDRPWGPERPIFGKIRYMSSENTARKVSVKHYIEKYGPSSQKQQRLPW
jgi:deoxyribodipyrimidine photo-lyase